LVRGRNIALALLLAEEGACETEIDGQLVSEPYLISIESKEELEQLVEGYFDGICVPFLLLQLNITIHTVASPIKIIYVLLYQCPCCTLHTLQQLLRAGHLIIPEEKCQNLETKLHTPYRLPHMLRNISNGWFNVLRNVALDAIGISVIQYSQRSKAIVKDLQLLLSIGHPG
jgi:hypothetical protein